MTPLKLLVGYFPSPHKKHRIQIFSHLHKTEIMNYSFVQCLLVFRLPNVMTLTHEPMLYKFREKQYIESCSAVPIAVFWVFTPCSDCSLQGLDTVYYCRWTPTVSVTSREIPYGIGDVTPASRKAAPEYFLLSKERNPIRNPQQILALCTFAGPQRHGVCRGLICATGRYRRLGPTYCLHLHD